MNKPNMNEKERLAYDKKALEVHKSYGVIRVTHRTTMQDLGTSLGISGQMIHNYLLSKKRNMERLLQIEGAIDRIASRPGEREKNLARLERGAKMATTAEG